MMKLLEYDEVRRRCR